jgi:hypothetical protein
MTTIRIVTIGDVEAAVHATRELIGTPGTTQEQLKSAAGHANEVYQAYVEQTYAAAQDQAQAQGEAEAG